MINDVTCTSASSCVAVGSYLDDSNARRLLIQHWDGSTWSPQTVSSGQTFGILNAVDCVSSTCYAVGSVTSGSSTTAIAVQSSGGAWVSAGYPTSGVPYPSSWSSLEDIACTAATSCTAVGSYSESTAGAQTARV